MYGNGFATDHPNKAKAIDDKQPSGSINLDQWILSSIENNMIPANQHVYSIYAGDLRIFEQLTEEEASFHESLTELYDVSDRIYITLGSYDSYLAF